MINIRRYDASGCALIGWIFLFFPPNTKKVIEHVPIVIYFPERAWDHFITSGGDLSLARVMNVQEMRKYGSCYCFDTVTQWMHQMMMIGGYIDYQSKSPKLLTREEYRQQCDEQTDELYDEMTEDCASKQWHPTILPSEMIQHRHLLQRKQDDMVRKFNQGHGTLTLIPEMYEPEFVDCRNKRIQSINESPQGNESDVISFEMIHEEVLYSVGYHPSSNIISVKIESQFMKVLMSFDLGKI